MLLTLASRMKETMTNCHSIIGSSFLVSFFPLLFILRVGYKMPNLGAQADDQNKSITRVGSRWSLNNM